MKQSANRFTVLIIFSIIIMQVFCGCGSSGGGSSESTATNYTISGRVVLPEGSQSLRLSQISLEKTTVRLEQQPAIYAICDKDGYFTLIVPKIYESINIIAFNGNLGFDNFYLQKSDDISLSNETTINAGKIKLAECKNTFSIKIKDKYNNPIKYAKCSFWGFELSSDINGVITFPLFPENIKQVKATINAAGYKELTNDYSVFSKNCGPCTEVILRSIDENKSPVILNFEPFDYEPMPNQ